MRVCAPSSLVAGVDHNGRRYASKTRIIDVPDDVGRHLVKNDEWFPAAGKPLGAHGFVCADCGFHAYFRTCGRCGGTCDRPS